LFFRVHSQLPFRCSTISGFVVIVQKLFAFSKTLFPEPLRSCCVVRGDGGCRQDPGNGQAASAKPPRGGRPHLLRGRRLLLHHEGRGLRRRPSRGRPNLEPGEAGERSDLRCSFRSFLASLCGLSCNLSHLTGQFEPLQVREPFARREFENRVELPIAFCRIRVRVPILSCTRPIRGCFCRSRL